MCSVEDGDWVLLLLSGGERRLTRVRRGAKLSAGKHHALMDPLIGAPFGANFRIEPSGLVRDSRTVEEISASVGDACADMAAAQPGASNAELVDDSTAQRLGEADIRRMKEAGTHGADLIKAIASNSSTFAGKTAFSQDKYLRKKAKKHMPFLTVGKPSPLSICDMYMNKQPDKLMMMRRDSLALMLALSNVQPGSRCLVVESTLGLLTGATAQRVAGDGSILSAHTGKPSLDGVQWLNLSQTQLGAVRTCHLAELLSFPPLLPPPTSSRAGDGADAPSAAADAQPAATGEPSGKQVHSVAALLPGDAVAEQASVAGAGPHSDGELGGSGARGGQGAVADGPVGPIDSGHDGAADGGTHAEVGGEGEARGATHGPAGRKLMQSLRGDALAAEASLGFTSLIVAHRGDQLSSAVLHLLRRLVPGSPFVVYHQSMQPLAECLHACQQAKLAIRLQLIETWSRLYQVAENRTHPTMNAYPATGYVLHGITVLPPAASSSGQKRGRGED